MTKAELAAYIGKLTDQVIDDHSNAGQLGVTFVTLWLGWLLMFHEHCRKVDGIDEYLQMTQAIRDFLVSYL